LLAAFLVMLREGVEAALIVAILLAYLNRLDLRSRARSVWSGTLAAVVASMAAGLILWNTVGGLEGTAEEVTEGIIAVLAVALLTWMIFWMGRQARGLKAHLQGQVDAALLSGGTAALGLVAFIAVLREGIESALFMLSTTIGPGSRGSQVVGGLLGLLGAIAIGYLFYRGSHLIDLRVFFRVTGLLIILFAAGLVAKGVHEFSEVGVLPPIVEHVWSLGFLDPDSSLTGRFLASLFGWDPDPSLLMVLGYLGYLVPVSVSFLRRTAAPPQPVGVSPSGGGSEPQPVPSDQV
jgi:high-affinity iron transporter